MASSLGTLVVKLGLDAAEFVAGISKSEAEAKKLSGRLDKAITAGAAKAAQAIAAIGVAAAAAFVAVDQAAKSVAKFQDIAEQTGDTAENMAALAASANATGLGMEGVTKASIKLSKNLVEVDKAGDLTRAALLAININIKDFQALAPAAQILAVGEAMGKFGDGSGKTAVAVQLLGKAGADLLVFFKELEDAGGREVILTQELIDKANAYADRQAHLKAQLGLYAEAIFVSAIPALEALITAVRNSISGLTDFATEANRLKAHKAIREFAEDTVRKFAFIVDAGDGVIRVFTGIGIAVGAALAAREFGLHLEFEKAREVIRQMREDLDALAMKRFFGQQLEDVIALQYAAEKAAREFVGPPAPSKPQVVYKGAAVAAAAAAKAQITDAEKLIEQLQSQIDKTKELTKVQEVQLAIAKAGFTGSTSARRAQALDLAAQIDKIDAAKIAADQAAKLAAEESQIRAKNSELLTREVAAEQERAVAIRASNAQLEQQIAGTLGGQEALDKLTLAKLDTIIADEKLRVGTLLNIEGTEKHVAAINEQIVALERQKALIDELKLAEKMRIEIAKLQDLKDTFSDALVSPLLDFVNQTKSAKDAFRSFIRSIEAILQQKAARGLADWIFGGKTQGGFDFSTIAKLFSSLLGGGGGVAGIGGFSGGGFGEHFATGTAYAPGGRAWVGESGPELVNLPRGSRVHSASASRAMTAPNMTFNVNVLPGANTHSARQAGTLLRDVVLRAMRDR